MRRILLNTLPLLLLAPLGAAAQTLLVGNKAEDTISFVDLETGEEVVRRDTGRAPHEIAVSPDGSLAAIVSYRDADFVGNSVHLFDIAKAEETGVIDLGESRAPHGIKWMPNTEYVVVTAEESEEVAILWPTGKRVNERIATDQEGSHMIALSPDGLMGYVANIGSGSFSVVDLIRMEKVRDVDAGEGTEAIAVTPDGETIVVGNNESRSIMTFDAESYERTGIIETDGVPIRIEISPDGRTMAVSFADTGEVAFYRMDNLKPRGRVELDEGSTPVTLLYAPDGKRLFAAATGMAQVVEIDPRRRRITRRFDVGMGSDGLGYSDVEVQPGG
jgi:DNA-binding beta-propeller fold protein YncE